MIHAHCIGIFRLRHKDLVSSVLRCHRFNPNESSIGGRNEVLLKELIHARNDQDQTLLSMIALQGPGLEEQKLLILRKEIQVGYVIKNTRIHSNL